MRQTELMFWVPEGRELWTGEARAVLGLLEGDRLDPALFHHSDDAERSPINGVPVVRFSSNGRLLRIIGIGPEGIHQVMTAFPVVIQALTRHFGQPVKTSIVDAEHDFAPSPAPRRYWIQNMFMTKGIEAHEKFAALDGKGKRDFLERQVVEGLRRQYEALGYDGAMPDLGFQLLAFKAHAVHRIKPGSPMRGTVADLVVQLNAKIAGHWTVGFLPSKGYGVLVPYRRPESPVELLEKVRGDKAAFAACDADTALADSE